MEARQFAAEVLFLDPDDVPPAAEALRAAGCELSVIPDATDDWPTVFAWITGATSRTLDDIGEWLDGLVAPLGGDVVQWNYGPPWPLPP
jgi:hypothetical protein